MTIREQIEEREKLTLSSFAALSSTSKGRLFPLEKDPIRTEYQRDRDRIIHSKAFRRLMHKTQVFLCPEDDHYRTRLTHTLEVCQIARTIARAMNLNEDLTEAIALGHDLGHTPFGHAGERMLQRCFDPDFAHYKQSLRVVDILEKMNLTFEVRDGIVNHAGNDRAATLEGRIVKLADRIAYINHDIDDAMRAGILSERDIPHEISTVLGDSHSARINALVEDLIQNTQNTGSLGMREEVAKAMDDLRTFMFAHVYTNPIAKGEESKARDIICRLYEYYSAHPEKIPADFQPQMDFDGMERVICDYIAGMTDKYAVYKFSEIFIPTTWQAR